MDHTINASIQIVPKTRQENYYELVDKAIEEIRASGLKYMVTPMETVLEGSYDEIISVFGKAQQVVLAAGATEIIVTIRLHIRKDGDVSFEEKTAKHQL